jgi:ribosome biogenesis protein
MKRYCSVNLYLCNFHLFYNFISVTFYNVQIRARFTTTYAQYRVPETAIAIPAKLGRYGMSEVINHLLELDPAVPFDFIINTTLVRTSLHKFITSNRIDTEKVIVIEYMPITSLSNEPETVECPAWIGALECPSAGSQMFAGCYDGQLRAVDVGSFSITGAVAAHDGPIRGVSTWVDASSGNLLVATGSKDQTVKIWNTQSDGNMTHLATGTSSMSSVECVKYWEQENMLLASDYGGNMFAYNSLDTAALTDESDDRHTKKKSKTSSGSSESVAPKDLTHKFSIRAHTQAISGMDISNDAGRVYTCSYDHSLKEWDMERQECVATFVGSKVCTSMHIRSGNNMIATSHPDGRVRLWDSRNRQDAVCAHMFPPSQSTSDAVYWTSQVKWSPTNAFIFAASNYNGEVCVWDIRSTVPLSTAEAHSGKVLCLDWLEQSSKGDKRVSVVSGGSDCAIKSSEFS